MKIGFALPVSGSWATPAMITHVARRAEELGYHSVWTFQRLLSDVDGEWGQVYRSVQDPLITLAYAAAITSRVRLGVAVVNLPFVTPTLLAKQGASLDILSGGRLDLGLGLGWSDEEYAASGASKERVGRRADEFIAALKTLWTDPVVAHSGEFYQIPATRMEPKPIQRPHPPILLGATAPAALRRVGRLADGWVSSSRADLATIGTSIELVRQAAIEAGRDPAALRFVCRGSVKVRDSGTADSDSAQVRDSGDPGPGPDASGATRPTLTGTLAEIRVDCVALAAKGITELFIDLNFDPLIGSPDADPVESARRADEALDAFAPGRESA